MESEFEEDVDFVELVKTAEKFTAEYPDSSPDELTEEITQEEMIACKKCGRQTPTTEKFCVHCGGKAQ